MNSLPNNVKDIKNEKTFKESLKNPFKKMPESLMKILTCITESRSYLNLFFISVKPISIIYSVSIFEIL